MTPGDEPDVAALLRRAACQGVHLWVEGSRLRYRAPAAGLPPGLASELKRMRSDLIEELRRRARSAERLDDLAANQVGIWLESRAFPDSSAYNLGYAVQIDGPIHREALQEAFQVLTDRHETLRTDFPEVAGRPKRRVRGAIDARVDWRAPRALPRTEAERWAQSEFERPFILDRAPLVRLVVQLGEAGGGKAALLVVAHHLVMDGISLTLARRELMDLYEALVRDRDLPASPGGADYQDFVEWQSGWLENGSDEARAYWARVLDPAPDPLNLPVDHPESGPRPYRANRFALAAPSELRESVRTFLATRGRTTPYVLFLAAFAALLRRLGGSGDFVVGTPVLGRPSTRFKETIGHFVNVVPLRLAVEDEIGFDDLIPQAESTVREAMVHSDLPLPEIVRPLMSRGSPLRALFTMRESRTLRLDDPGWRPDGSEERQRAGLRVDPLPLRQQPGRFDLALSVDLRADELVFHWSHDGAAVDEATVRSWATALQVLLEAAVEEPDRAVGKLPLTRGSPLDAAWEGSAGAHAGSTALDRILSWASAAPERTAVRDERGELSYGDVAHAAERLGVALAEAGVAKGDRVGLSLGRTSDMIVAILAAWRAGAAYVPLDPSFPEARLRWMVEDAGIGLIVADAEGRSVLQDGLSGEVRTVDPDAEPDSPASTSLVQPRPEDVAYVLYTSGSTGRPKGVAVGHRALSNLLGSMAEKPGLGREDTLVAVTTLSFDISILELMLPLTVGAQVVIVPRGVTMDGAELARVIEDTDATTMQATPATWRMLLDAGWRASPGFVALCGGEALTRQLADRLLESGAELWNLYGPTETTVWSTVGRVRAGESAPPDLGEPIHGTRLYVLEGSGAPVPQGFVGELWIGGEGVAEGYLGDEGRTRERFRPDPAGGRMYRTGDLVRVRGDGRLEYRGRTDQQLKVRGFRIEAVEVESALESHPGVGVAAVDTRADAQGSTALVAWVEPAGDRVPTVEELRRAAARRLPEYMVPTRWTFVDPMPRTPNGKLDRGALVAESSAMDAGLDSTAPRTDAEARMVQVWAETLGLEEGSIGVHADFFRLGGHSLLAQRLIWAVNRCFQTDLSVRALLEAPTVADLSLRVELTTLSQREAVAGEHIESFEI